MSYNHLPHRAYPEDVAARLSNALRLSIMMAEAHYPHLVNELKFTEKRVKETEILFDKGMSLLNK
jgi:hypothetical protein